MKSDVRVGQLRTWNNEKTLIFLITKIEKGNQLDSSYEEVEFVYVNIQGAKWASTVHRRLVASIVQGSVLLEEAQ